MNEVTEEEFLIALAIVRRYQQQLDFIVKGFEPVETYQARKVLLRDLITVRRVRNVLHTLLGEKWHNSRVEDLRWFSGEDLLKVPGCGYKTYREIREIMENAGVELNKKR